MEEIDITERDLTRVNSVLRSISGLSAKKILIYLYVKEIAHEAGLIRDLFLPTNTVKKSLQSLREKGFIKKAGVCWELTPKGIQVAEGILIILDAIKREEGCKS